MLMAHAARNTLVTVEEIVEGNLLEDATRCRFGAARDLRHRCGDREARRMAARVR